ncbi:MAG: BLUF domain-containing protein [Pseudomonadota bacterium]
MLDASSWRATQVLYFSAPTRALNETELQDLADHVQGRNESLGLTGFLYASPSRFCQLLEGPEEDVLDLMEKIIRDNRHDKVQVMIEASTLSPVFHRFHVRLRHGIADQASEQMRLHRLSLKMVQHICHNRFMPK